MLAQRHFPPMKARICGIDEIGAADILIATAWQTAYPVLNAEPQRQSSLCTRLRAVVLSGWHSPQLAANTYRFGLTGITAGPWLAGKLDREFGMSCKHFDFGSDAGRYRFQNPARRNKVLFYARPSTPRRGFELGRSRSPSSRVAIRTTSHLLGSTIDYRLPFQFVSHGVLSAEQLNELYNQAAAGLVISLTNMSLLPLELLAAGCIPVVTDGEHNRAISDNSYIAYAPTSPHALAQALNDVVHRPDLPDHAERAAASVSSLSWEDAERRVEQVLVGALTEAEARVKVAQV